MRKLVTLSSLAAIGVAACVAAERPTATHHDHEGGGALLAQSVDMSRVDTDGLPDLIVEPKMTENSWRVKDEFLGASFCSVEEGNITPGDRRVLRFSVMTPNIGDADVFVGNPIVHMDPNGDGNTADQDGMFEFATCHNHFHFKNYATYRLIDGKGRVWRAAKRGFCMLDTDPYNTGTGDGNWTYRSCGTTTIPGFQGVSKGWADTYRWFLAGQFFVLDGGDGQALVPPGTYVIEIHVNPPYAPDKKGNCPLAKDVNPVTRVVRCFQFAESNYDNNIGRATVTIPDHPGREGYGPLKGTADPTPADETRKG